MLGISVHVTKCQHDYSLRHFSLFTEELTSVAFSSTFDDPSAEISFLSDFGDVEDILKQIDACFVVLNVSISSGNDVGKCCGIDRWLYGSY